MRSRPLQPRVTLSLPPYLKLHTASTLTYNFTNPTARLLTLSLQVDSSDSFVFAGPRKTPTIILAPSESREFSLAVIPLSIGPCALPRLRVFEQAPSSLTQGEEEGAASRSREIDVVAEQALEQDLAQKGLETDLRAATGAVVVSEDSRQGADNFLVLVLPR